MPSDGHYHQRARVDVAELFRAHLRAIGFFASVPWLFLCYIWLAPEDAHEDG
jgi:hypothetical protein